MDDRLIILPKNTDPGGRAEPIVRLVKELSTYQPKRPVKVKWSIALPDRTPAENRYLWAVPYTMIAEYTGMERAEIHEWNCGNQWGWKNKKVPKKPSNPTGIESVPIRTTTTNADGEDELCSEEEFLELWARAQRLGASLGINIPDPDPDYARKRDVQP